ncbi:malonyl-ACP O-methyltransferase BioC [Flammeovirga pacifica]|uniref:Malonyl-[acyl-carrier protein] O-methyltransferase n=1 Tax=Flammeovirga pacifica TaxID=915059 RepID=A0A1S1YVE1_FLAPC|nr:malonyl-ACP O-methyltransferase BioC [Flammeovirga pacifica]OHX64991.1 malonyl-[acyl-carrier protein] O-methyltransferase BioC [Flammeovirga pacifica]
MIPLDKVKVQQRFGKNAGNYQQEAAVQKMICEELYQEILLVNQHFENSFEIGCGCGFLTEQLEKHIAHKNTVNDLHKNCTYHLLDDYPQLSFLEGDAEKIMFPENNDLVVSSSAFQWMENLNGLIKKINHSLSMDGLFAFSTFGKKNYQQIKKITGSGLLYHDLNHWITLLEDNNFEVIKSWEWTKDLWFNSATDVLKHIKKTGVNGMQQTKEVWNKKRLAAFNVSYNHFSENNQVPLTYHPLFIIAKKK